MARTFYRFFTFALALPVFLAASPALAQMYNSGDACPEPTAGRVVTVEGSAGPALVCNGTTLEVYESVLTGPLRKGIGTATPQATLDISSTDSVLLPRGTTAQRPGTPVNGMIRYNSTNNKFEAYENGAWTNVIGGGASLWTDNTTHISRGTVKILNAGQTMTSAGLDGGTSGLIWHEDKKALRVGDATGGGRWNESNIGTYSVAMGYQSWAIGSASTAIGSYAYALKSGGVAIGWLPSSYGNFAVGIGQNVIASGDNSTSFGADNRVNGTYSMGIGLGSAAGTYPLVSGNNSFGMFMGDHSNVNFAATKTMGLFGGKMVIDPAVPATQLSARGVIDVGAATDAIVFPRGTTAERPGTPVNGMIRYNSTTNKFEAYQNSAWVDMIGGGSSLWTQTGSDIYYNTGKVGVGTASPAATLHVNGEAIIGNTSLACSGTTEGAQRYNSTDHVMEFCNGTSWTPFAQVQTTPGPTAPAGSGYFVLTETTWDGDLGGLTGADAKCLTELGTTYTSWRGYTTANSNGQITASKVHAFLCDRDVCNNPMPLTTYYFAYANDGTPGGASFTTDASGLGPGDSAIWSAANYFSGSYTYWTGRDNSNIPLWGTAVYNNDVNCASWTNNAGNNGYTGNSGYTDERRWSASGSVCSGTRRLICFVDP